MSTLAFAFVFITVNTASAHVVVKPSEVVTAGYQTFTVGVPNEKDIPTVSVKVIMPENLENATPTQKSGWQIVKEISGNGEDAKTASITWEGGSIAEGTRDDFTFSAKVPEQTTSLQWKAYQTYADGTVVSWDQEPEEGGHGHSNSEPNTGPFSVTEVVKESSQDNSISKADQAAADAKVAAERALYAAIAAIALSVVGIFLAFRKK